MKKIQSNLHYFKISQENLENNWDGFYIFDEKHPDLKSYISNTKRIKNILITIKTLQEKGEKSNIIEKYFLELADLLGDFSTCSEFACFINACDSFLEEAKKDSRLLEKIVNCYFKKRVLNEYVPEEWIQAILDSNSSRKKGKCGEKKLGDILFKNGFKKVNNWECFFETDKCFAEFSKVFDIKNVRKNLNIKMATKKQNKKLDLIIKRNEKIFLCEAKHLNTSGGEQDKQISELIDIIGLKEKNYNIHYISFLDGSYSNQLLNSRKGGEKLETQRKEIRKNLLKNKNNFWVNTAGFKELVKDLG